MTVSCGKSGLEAPRQPGEPNGTPVTVALSSVSTPAPVEASEYAPGTKSSAELTEGAVDGQIHDLWALQYDGSGNLVGTPYYTADIPAGTAGTAGSGTDYSYDGLSVKLTSSGADTHTVCFVANTHNGSLFTVDNDVSTLDKLKAAAWGFGDEYRPAAGGGIVMMGEYAGPVASGTPVTGVKLERRAAKVVLKYKVSRSGFTVTNVQLKNVPAAFGFADAPSGNVNFPAVADGSHIDYPAEDLTKAVTDGDYKKFVWYMPENISRAVASVDAIGDRTLDKSDGRPAYVEITGVLNTDGRVRKAVYRILLGDPSLSMDNFQVQRNHIYTVTLDIQGLNEGDNRVTVENFDMSNCAIVKPGSGMANAADAGTVTFDIRKCLNNGFTTKEQLNALMTASSDLTADVLWTDCYDWGAYLIDLDKENGLLTVSIGFLEPSSVDGNNMVVALYPNADKKQGEILWSWHIWMTDYAPDQAGVAARTPNTAYRVDGGEVHTYGSEFQKVNGNSKVIMDRNLGAMKSYNGSVPAADDIVADWAFGLLYQWGRKDPFPWASGATIDPNTATASTKAIYGADSNPLPEDGMGYKKVNIADVIGGGPNTLAYAVKNPLAFIYNTTAPYDWYTTAMANQNTDLWGDGAAKSVYDPCPKGWRIAPKGTWNDFTRDTYTPANGTFPYYANGEIIENGNQYFATNGGFYNNMVWYPATGFRESANGNLIHVGKSGFNWSAGVRITSACFTGAALDFNSGFVGPTTPDNSGHSFPVRCIQE